MYQGIASFILVFLYFPFVIAGDFTLSHSDPEWNGKVVPKKGICKYFSGGGYSPEIKVSNIPSGAVKLDIQFTDLDYGNTGGHGKFEMTISGVNEITIPSMQGESSEKLPLNIRGIKKNHSRRGNATKHYYLGACSGGRSHTYVVYIYARDEKGKKLSKAKLKLGNY